MAMRVSTSTVLTITGAITARELIEHLRPIPSEASLRISEYKGDQRDPGYTTITATWDLERSE